MTHIWIIRYFQRMVLFWLKIFWLHTNTLTKWSTTWYGIIDNSVWTYMSTKVWWSGKTRMTTEWENLNNLCLCMSMVKQWMNWTDWHRNATLLHVTMTLSSDKKLSPQYFSFFYAAYERKQRGKKRTEEKRREVLTEEAASMAFTAAWKTLRGSRRLVVPLSTILLS